MDFNKIKGNGSGICGKGPQCRHGSGRARQNAGKDRLGTDQNLPGHSVSWVHWSTAWPKGNEENQPLVDKYIEMISSIEANLNALKESLGPAAEVITHDLDEEPEGQRHHH